MTNDNEIIMNERLLGRFMQEQRKKNISLLQRSYAMTYDDAEDIYQDACMALFRNIQDGKLVELTARLSTYFTQICVFQAMKRIRDSKQSASIEGNQYDAELIDELLTGSDYSIPQQLAMMEMVKSMPEPCRTILWQFHYENKSMAEIAPMVNFNGDKSVKAKKSQCLSKLKSTFENRINNLKDGEE